MAEKRRVDGKRELMFYGCQETSDKVEDCYKEVKIELDNIVQEKQLLLAEEKIIETVRQKI